MTKFFPQLMALCAVVFLGGCGEDVPSDQLAAKTVRKYAEQVVYPGLEITNYVRDNGWVDEDAPNRYKVQYTFDLKLVQPFPVIVLDNAKLLAATREQDAPQKNTGLFDVAAIQKNLEALQQEVAVNQWIEGQGESFMPRYKSLIKNCTPCIAFLFDQEVSPEARSARFNAFASSWGFFEDLGIEDEAQVGSSIPRSAWAAFMKTEKGWQPVE